MILEDFHCDTLELFFQFEAEDFDREAFDNAISEVEEVERYSDDEVDEYSLSFGSSDESRKPHAHLRLRLRKEKPSAVELSYHNSKLKDVSDKLPLVDGCARWLGGFFKSEKIEIHIHAGYTYDDSYSSVIPLLFPLATTEKALVGAYVTGMSILLPKDGAADSAIIQGTADQTVLFLSNTSEIDLKSFDLRSELERLSTAVDALMRKKEGGESNGNTGE